MGHRVIIKHDGFGVLDNRAYLHYENNTVLSAEFCLKDIINDSDILDPNYITLIDEEGGWYGELSTKGIVKDLRDFADWLEKGPQYEITH